MNVYINPKPPKLNKFERLFWNILIGLMLLGLLLCVVALIGGILFGLLPSIIRLAKGH